MAVCASFEYNIDVLCTKFNATKGNMKRSMKRVGLEQIIDYTVTVPQRKSYGGQNNELVLLTKQAFDQMDLLYATRTRRDVSCVSGKVAYVKRYMPKETETLDFIHESLQSIVKVERQYQVLTYRIDMYIPDAKLAIECDEQGHKGRDVAYEKQRQQDIETALGCTFLRYNPDDATFRLATLLNAVLTKIWTWEKQSRCV